MHPSWIGSVWGAILAPFFLFSKMAAVAKTEALTPELVSPLEKVGCDKRCPAASNGV
jgi:hypothetical protein